LRKTMVIILALILLLSPTLIVAPLEAVELGPKGVQAVNLSNGTNPATIKQEKALEVLKAAFPEILAGKELEAEYSEEGRGNNPCWNFNLKAKSEGPGYSDSVITANVNALTGEILAMNYNPPADYYHGKSVQLTREQAYPIAQQFVQKMHADKIAMLVLTEDRQSYYVPQNKMAMYYGFYWNRQVNGIKADWDSIYIGVDAATGKVSHYAYNWHNKDLPKPGKIIPAAELTCKLVDQFGLYPVYVQKPGSMESGIFIPVYRLNTNSQLFDSQTSQPLRQDGSKVPENEQQLYKQEFKPQLDSSPADAPADSNTKVTPELAKQTAENIFIKMGITGAIRRSGGGSSSGAGYNEEYWNYSLVENQNRQRFDNGPEISINTATGEIKDFNDYSDRDIKGAATISFAEALRVAQDAIQKINPEKKNHLVLLQRDQGEGNEDVYNFCFTRLVNGISCEQDRIEVEINKQNGKLSRYRLDWHPFKFIAPDHIISLEKAKKIFINKQPFELAYIYPMNLNGSYENKETEAAVLVYRNAEQFQMDALSGEMLGDGWGEQNPIKKNSYTGHWAAPALSLLEESRLLPKRLNRKVY